MDPRLLVRLVALNERTRQAWAHPHNRSFYRPASFRGFSVRDEKTRDPTPSDEELVRHHQVQDTEPELRLYLDNRPKNICNGWVFGSDQKTCDVYCGEHSISENYNISRQTFLMTIDKQGHVILNHLRNKNQTHVKYGVQKTGERQAFVWIMFPSCKDLVVSSARHLRFKVVVTDPSEANKKCRSLHLQYRSQFFKDAVDAMSWMPFLSMDSGSKTPKPFYYIRQDRVLGSGTFGKVYVVVDVSTGVEYAGKTFYGYFDPEEVEILAKQNHENILRFISLSEDDGPLLVTEYLKEGSLSRPWVAYDRAPWQVDQIASTLIQSLRGLARLHANPDPVIHRDIKPENILVADRDRGSGPWIKLADFGLASQGTKCEGQDGTFLYSAPEVFCPVRYTSKVDIWSLGVVILQLLLQGNIPIPSGDYFQGVQWCEDLFRNARRNSTSSVEEDRQELRENEYSLRSFLWVFIKNFMLQGNMNKRLSAQECLNHPMLLQMQYASRLSSGWRPQELTFDAKGHFKSTKFNIIKQFPPKTKLTASDFNGGAVTKQKHTTSSKKASTRNKTAIRGVCDPGVEVAVALRTQESKRTKTAKSSRAPNVPQPIGFGLVFEGYCDYDKYAGRS